MKHYPQYTTTIKTPSNEVRSKVAERLNNWNLSFSKDQLTIQGAESVDDALKLISSETAQQITAITTSNKNEGKYTFINRYSKGEKALIDKIINVCSSPFEYDELADKKGAEFADRVINKATDTARILLKALDNTPDAEQIKDFEFAYQFMLDEYMVKVKLQWNCLNFEVFEHSKKEVSEWKSIMEPDEMPF